MSNQRKPDNLKPSKKVRFLVGIWSIIVFLEIIMPINYWVVNFGWEFFNNSNANVLQGWMFGFFLTMIGGGIFFEQKWKFFSYYDSQRYEIGDILFLIAFPTFISVIVGIVGYLLAEWVGVAIGVMAVCGIFAIVCLTDLDNLKKSLTKN